MRGSLAATTAVALLLLGAKASPDTASELEEIASSFYPANEPGAAVLVMRDGEVLLRKGYGLADMEHGIEIEPDTVFRIGSVTKQFTAAAILLLEEQGKLSVTDDIRKHLPDYPTEGRTIKIEHLMTHTSGIRSYTDMEEFPARARDDLTVDEVIALFRDEPLAFEPGEKYAYNNSGYFLLGAIVERVSGKPYEAFLHDNVFEPLGMTRTFYGSASRIIRKRAQGYSGANGEFANAEYLSMTIPYAAGALLSTVDDLAKWDEALYGTGLLSRASLDKAWKPFHLRSGESTHYGYGWGVSSLDGRLVLSHGGGINGFLCQVIRVPEERLFVAVLTNRSVERSSPSLVARKLAAAALGEPMPTPSETALESRVLDSYVGLYRAGDEVRYLVSLDEGRLRIKRFGDEHPEGGRTRNPGPNEGLNRVASLLLPVSETAFLVEDSTTEVRFEKSATVGSPSLVVDDWGREERAERTDEPFDDESRVLAAIDVLFNGMSRRDEEALRSVLDPAVRIVQTQSQNGRAIRRTSSVDEFVSRIVQPEGGALRERIWDPEVRVADNLASVWAPYAFYVGEKLTHCGEDAFHLLRTDVGWPGWKITALAYTRRTEGCAPPP